MGSRVAGLWTDLGEPERHPDGMVHFLGSAAKVHNIYNLLWAKTIFDGFGRFRPGERIFNLTRSGFAGIQRYGVIPWSGDVSRTFGGLAAQLPMLLSMGMSGLAYHNSDIGGYARNPTTPELYVRWMEYGAFCPVARAHGAGEMVNGFPTEPWQFGPAAEEICRSVLRLRYRLLPYIYTLAHQAYRSGLPLARPLIMMYPGDARFINESSSFMLGDELLVAPVVGAGETERRVDLPEGDWVNYWTGEVIRGGTSVDVPAPLGTIPLFVKSGSILPMAPPMEYSDQKPLDTLTLCVYPAAGRTGSFTLYEDDGATTAYQSGSYSLTRFEQSVRNLNGLSRLVVGLGKSEGEFTGKVLVRTYVLEIHGVRGVRGDVRIDGKSLPDLSSVAAGRASGNGYRFDSTHSRLTITVTGSTARASGLAVSGLRLQ
jgi:alpha-glucosidase (family GH31 glycosyl hydrolase)